MKKIIITGGTGRFGTILKKNKTRHKLFFPNKHELDIKKLKTIKINIEPIKTLNKRAIIGCWPATKKIDPNTPP